MREPLVLDWETPEPEPVLAILALLGAPVTGGDPVVRVRRGAAERLLLQPAADDLRAGAVRDRTVPSPPEPGAGSGTPRPTLVVGVATVDLERAAAALEGMTGRLPPDGILGARAAAVADARLVLLEPATEGRLAATLARHGEGPAALYVVVGGTAAARTLERLGAAGIAATGGDGPLGRQHLVGRGRSAGPHLLLVEGPDHGVAAPSGRLPSRP